MTVIPVNWVGLAIFAVSGISAWLLTLVLSGDAAWHQATIMQIAGLVCIASDLVYRWKKKGTGSFRERLFKSNRGGLFVMPVWILGILLVLVGALKLY